MHNFESPSPLRSASFTHPVTVFNPDSANQQFDLIRSAAVSLSKADAADATSQVRSGAVSFLSKFEHSVSSPARGSYHACSHGPLFAIFGLVFAE